MGGRRQERLQFSDEPKTYLEVLQIRRVLLAPMFLHIPVFSAAVRIA